MVNILPLIGGAVALHSLLKKKEPKTPEEKAVERLKEAQKKAPKTIKVSTPQGEDSCINITPDNSSIMRFSETALKYKSKGWTIHQIRPPMPTIGRDKREGQGPIYYFACPPGAKPPELSS